MVASFAVVAVEEFACFISSFNAGIAECSEFLNPEIVRGGTGGGRVDVDIEDRDVITTFSDVEARNSD